MQETVKELTEETGNESMQETGKKFGRIYEVIGNECMEETGSGIKSNWEGIRKKLKIKWEYSQVHTKKVRPVLFLFYRA